MKWKKYPDETPFKMEGTCCECLCRGISAATKSRHYYVCQWVWFNDVKGFYYNGNEFNAQCVDGEFEWVYVEQLEKVSNCVDNFMYYMCNRWCHEEAVRLFGENLGNHIWEKWVDIVRFGCGDQLTFYANIDKECRKKLGNRANEIYDK